MWLFLINMGVFFVAILHVWFFILETFLWQKPIGLKSFRTDLAFAKRSASLAANLGLYNLFLSVGLFWSLYSNYIEGLHLKIFFLSCVLVAGIYAGITASVRIFFIQGVPAAVTLILIGIAH